CADGADEVEAGIEVGRQFGADLAGPNIVVHVQAQGHSPSLLFACIPAFGLAGKGNAGGWPASGAIPVAPRTFRSDCVTEPRTPAVSLPRRGRQQTPPAR